MIGGGGVLCGVRCGVLGGVLGCGVLGGVLGRALRGVAFCEAIVNLLVGQVGCDCDGAADAVARFAFVACGLAATIVICEV